MWHLSIAKRCFHRYRRHLWIHYYTFCLFSGPMGRIPRRIPSSVIFLVFLVMNATHQFMTSGATAAPHLTGLCHYMGKAFGITSILFGFSKTLSVFIAPPNAAAIAGDGYSKQDIRKYLVENARLPVDEINTEFAYTEERVVPWTVHNLVEEGKAPNEWDVAPGERMPIIESPELIDIFVCGSRDRNRNMIFRSSYNRSITREIKLPADWNVGK